MNLDRKSTALPPPPRKRRRDWGRVLARVFCVIFAIVGLVPVGLTFVTRSAWAQKWAARETERILREQGIAVEPSFGSHNIHVAVSEKYLGALQVADVVRPQAKAAMIKLRNVVGKLIKRKIDPLMPAATKPTTTKPTNRNSP